MLADQALEVPGPATERLGQTARDAAVYLAIGVEEREPHGGTIYNSVLYFGQDGSLLGKHRKLDPTEIERTVWGRATDQRFRPIQPRSAASAVSRAGKTARRSPFVGRSVS